VWLYHRFPLSLCEVQEMMAQLGWWRLTRRCGSGVRSLGRPTSMACADVGPCPGDKWHLDEVFIKINVRSTICGGGGQHGNVLDTLVASRRDTKAATRFFRKLLTRLEYVSRVLVTDKLASYQAARRRYCGRWSTFSRSI
jgi:putative transposase